MSVAKTDATGVSTSKVHKSSSVFSPGRCTKGKPGRRKTSSSPVIALKGDMSTPTALMLNRVRLPSVPKKEATCRDKCETVTV